ncbi:hypothetical protein Pfo_013005 [Paulownia fortunei]|nr:hypothetical protein Pfo_013005 [Paulownia fortunei]
MCLIMAAEQEKNGVIDDGGKCEELDKGTENQAVTEIVVLDSDGSESHDGGAAKSRGASIGSTYSSCVSRPIPPFLLKIYDMLGNDEANSVVSWSCTGTSFVITNPHLFAANVLPIYFRHRNFQSFVTQLNSYGFKKISWEQWEYKNEYFRKGERHLLKNIKRRNQMPHRFQPTSDIEPSVDASSLSNNMEKELEILMKDHDLLKVEIMKLKQKQEILEEKIASLKNQAMSNEKDQKRLMFAAQRILRMQRDLSNTGVPLLEDDRKTHQKNLKGKGKLEERAITKYNEPTVCSDLGSCSIVSLADILEQMSEHFTRQGKMLLNEEEMGKHQSDTFISLEDLIGESSDWVEYIKELQEKASHLKS